MSIKGLLLFLLSLLGITLTAVGLYELISPMVPFGSLGMIIIGLIIIVIGGYFGGKKMLS